MFTCFAHTINRENKGGFKYALHKENIRFITDRLYRFNNWMQCAPIWHRGSSKTHVSEKYGRYSKRYCKSKAEEEHQEFELSDEFVSKYLDMDSFEELKKRTQEGIAATSNEAGMTKQEILLWRDLIKKKLAMQYTTDNYDQKKKELEDSLDQMAEEHQMNRKDFYEKYYDMTEEDTEAFVKKQAEKLTESSDDVSEQAQGSEKQ